MLPRLSPPLRYPGAFLFDVLLADLGHDACKLVSGPSRQGAHEFGEGGLGLSKRAIDHVGEAFARPLGIPEKLVGGLVQGDGLAGHVSGYVTLRI